MAVLFAHGRPLSQSVSMEQEDHPYKFCRYANKESGSVKPRAAKCRLMEESAWHEIRHKGTRHPGQQQAIIPPETFAAVAERLASNGHERKTGRNAKSPSLLAGLIVDVDGNKLISTHATKGGKRYRYYISKALHHGRSRDRLGRDCVMHLEASGAEAWRPPATDIEAIVIRELVSLLTSATRVLALAGALQPDRPLSIPERATIVSTGKVIATDLGGADGVIARGRILELLSRIERGYLLNMMEHDKQLQTLKPGQHIVVRKSHKFVSQAPCGGSS